VSDSCALPLLAALYHESSRASVTTGQTLAHTVGQARPFIEWPDLRQEAKDGREMTAGALLERFVFNPRHSNPSPARLREQIDALAPAIHECERDAIEQGLVAVVLDPPRPWVPFNELPEVAQEGRRGQARYLLTRFAVSPRPKGPPTFAEMCEKTACEAMASGLERNLPGMLAEAREWFRLAGLT